MNVDKPFIRTFLTKYLLEARVNTLNPPAPTTVRGTDPVSVALQKMKENSLGSLLVKSPQGGLEGIFTEQDAVRRVALQQTDLTGLPVKEVMTPNPETLRPRASIARAIYYMAKGGYRHLPIAPADTFPTGLVSVRDTVRYIFSLIEKSNREPGIHNFLNAEALSTFLDSPVSMMDLHPANVMSSSHSTTEGLEEMSKSRLGSLAIVDESGVLIGIFTERDYITKIANNAQALIAPLKTTMTGPSKFVRADSSMQLCIQLMSEGGYRHLPVTDEQGKPIRMLSVRDFINAFGDSVIRDLEAQKKTLSEK